MNLFKPKWRRHVRVKNGDLFIDHHSRWPADLEIIDIMGDINAWYATKCAALLYRHDDIAACAGTGFRNRQFMKTVELAFSQQYCEIGVQSVEAQIGLGGKAALYVTMKHWASLEDVPHYFKGLMVTTDWSQTSDSGEEEPNKHLDEAVIEAILRDDTLDDDACETTKCEAIEHLVESFGWREVEARVVGILETPGRRDSDYYQAACVIWGACCDKRKVHCINRVIALLYARLPNDQGSTENNLVWSITSRLKGKSYLSKYDPLKDSGVQRHYQDIKQ